MVKTLPERVRTRVHHTISPSQTQKSAPPATTPRGDKKSDDDSIAKRERERERETKKERSPAAGDDPHWPTLYTWDWMLCGSQYAQIRTSSKCNASSSSPPLSRAQKSCECVNVLLLSTTNGGVPSSPGGGAEQRFGTAFVCVMSSAGKEEKKLFVFCLKP